MKIVGAGLSRTGTRTLHQALQILGFKSIHFDTHRLNDILDGSTPHPNFRRYDDVDAVVDLPSACFYRELLEAYSESKAILTIRNVDDWWKSISYHWNARYPLRKPGVFFYIARTLHLKRWPGRTRDEYNIVRNYIRNYVYGSISASEFLYKKKYIEHNERVQATVPSHRLLVMNITAGDGWEKLCPFLEMPIPPQVFPHEHKSAYETSGSF